VRPPSAAGSPRPARRSNPTAGGVDATSGQGAGDAAQGGHARRLYLLNDGGKRIGELATAFERGSPGCVGSISDRRSKFDPRALRPKENLLIIKVTIDSGWHFFGLPSARPHPAPKDVGMFYIHADPPKSLPPIPVRVSRRSQLTAALRQHARPIVIEDQKLAGPFVRLLRARQLRLWGLGEFVANTMSCGIDQSYGANVEAHWYVGRYVLPGNVQKVILKPKPYGAGRLPRHLQA
jgi:hypothetical protein